MAAGTPVPAVIAHIDAVTAHAVRAAAPAFYTVQPGDSLSAIAQKLFGSQDKWPYLYSANLKVVGSDPNLITPGMKLSARLASTPAYGQQQSFGGGTAVLASSSVSSAGNQPDPAPAYQAPVQPQVQSGGYNGGTPGGSFGACVVARESGGNAQVMNSSGHYGLYQFSQSTWEAYGGSASSFGNASVSQQEQVFANAMAAGGQSNWSPYDGC